MFNQESLNKNQRVGGRLLSLGEGPLQLAQECIWAVLQGCCQKHLPTAMHPQTMPPQLCRRKDLHALLREKCPRLEGVF